MKNLKEMKWCWDNNWYVDVVPTSSGVVRVEVHRRIDVKTKWGKPTIGTKLIQVGKEEFNQKNKKEKENLYEEVRKVYKLIYDKYNEKR